MDCDDTILATRETRWAVLQETARRFGRQLTQATLAEEWGKPFPELIVALVPDVDSGLFVDAYSRALANHPPQATPGAVDFLRYLCKLGVRMELVTSGSRSLILQDLRELHLDHYFAGVYVCEDSVHHKPDPRALDPVVKCLLRDGYDLREIACVGDSTADYAAAAGAELVFYAVTTGLSTKESFLSAGLPLDHIYSNPEALLQAIRARCDWVDANPDQGR